ncbi:hypothetical protein [Streptomyces sp. NPDC053542]|uniref:hypothetical protein n=1 Tax=Streptomyces sp. NPDC053542 TaxID=3365710 RepID=UPI0037CFF043
MAAAVALATMLTSCSGSSDTDTGAEDAKGGDSTSSAPVAEPGEFDSLPEPCGLPARSTLRSLLPTDGTPETRAEADKIYRGRADVTFDTDRRVGCHWKRETSEGTRHLNIDLQRVVSYDGSLSDDDKAQELYAKKELAAHIPTDASSTPAHTPTPSASKDGKGSSKDPKSSKGTGDDSGSRPAGGKGPTADPSAGTAGSAQRDGSRTADSSTGNTAGNTAGDAPGDARDGDSGKSAGSGNRPSDTRTAEGDTPGSAGSSGSPDPSGSPGSGSPDDAASLAPRPLTGLGDAAFLDDALVTADSGLHRDVTVVFRSSNVIVTIEYDQWSTDKSVLPDRRELQEKARALAAELAAHWTE